MIIVVIRIIVVISTKIMDKNLHRVYCLAYSNAGYTVIFCKLNRSELMKKLIFNSLPLDRIAIPESSAMMGSGKNKV